MRRITQLHLTIGLLLSLHLGLFAQKTFPQNGVYDERDGLFAFTNATIYKAWNEKIDNATLVIRDGRVEAVGAGISVPKDAVVFDLKGKSIYPSFVELFDSYGMPEIMRAQGGFGRVAQQMVSNKRGAFSWNEALKTEFKAHENFAAVEKDAEILRGVGFGAVLTHRFDGISRGSAALVSTASGKEHTLILKPTAAHVLSFSKGSTTQSYPSSLMGAIALLRQTYLDGQWYATEGVKEEKNFSLEAWNALQPLPQIFDVGDRLEALRAGRIAQEFGTKYIIKGRGDEYQRINDIKALNVPFIVSLQMPDAMDVEDPYDALNTSLSELKHWELAATNAGALTKAGVEIALSTHLLRDKKDLFKQIQKAIENGLTEADALKALTATPAKLLGMNDLGNLSKGAVANFLITSGSIFSKENKIFHNWVQGKGYVINDLDKPELKGNYTLTVGNQTYKMALGAENTVLKNDTAKSKIDLNVARQTVNLSFTPAGETGAVRLSGIVAGESLSGQAQLADGSWTTWKAIYNSAETKESKPAAPTNATKPKSEPMGAVNYPFGAFGRLELPKTERILFKNATVWTSETDGILSNTDVLIEGGKILQIGKNLSNSLGKTIDATGKHLTAGIIDEHSHIAASKGINEGTQSSSAEVRITDVINSEDVNIYRQLAGGVTAVHVLHGSANAIGGQTQLIKLRWGVSPEEMKMKDWPGYIKFALGENVKQSNWGLPPDQLTRFPQSRMGVEQVFVDHFTRAKEYLTLKKSGKPMRRDLELEALAEILEGKRHITCHSYVQSEITMLLRVAERFGFKVNTFTHILEGYKVADKMAKHGAAASSFADWWAYKMEVWDAIPQSPHMMNAQGVVTSINSDDAEMARRLNQEAAKSVMYANMKEEEAWKMVTINPAKILRIGDRTGSIKVGKDADLVLWNNHPLSIYAKAEQTFVDGIKYFDVEEDKKLRQDVSRERARLVQKMIQAKKSGAPTQPVAARVQRMYDCEDVEDELSEFKD